MPQGWLATLLLAGDRPLREESELSRQNPDRETDESKQSDNKDTDFLRGHFAPTAVITGLTKSEFWLKFCCEIDT